MITKNKIFFILFLTLASCKSYDIKPGSERIRVFEAEPKGCIFLGEIPSVQENSVTPRQAHNIEMDLPTRVDLRNKAFALNGNVIIFAKNKKPDMTAPAATDAKKTPPPPPPAAAAASGTPSAAPPVSASAEAENEEKKVTTVFLATVFRCPPNIVNQ